MRRLVLSIAVAACAATAFAQPAADAPAAPGKKAVTSPADLPRRQYAIALLPSEMVSAPRDEVQPVLDALDKDIAGDLAALDVQDRVTLNGLLGVRAQVALHRGDYPAALALIRDVRAQQQKAADKLTSGVVLEQIVLARQAGGTLDEQRARLRQGLAQQYGAMPWGTVAENVLSAKGNYEHMARGVMLEGLRAGMDAAAKNFALNVPGGMLSAIVAVRNTFEHVLPFREDVVAVLRSLVEKNNAGQRETAAR